MRRRALGKGLGSLLPERPVAAAGGGLLQIEVGSVVPNPNQPREHFDQAELEDLAASIRTAGILQPILVRETGSGFELIAGERRWRAARIAGLSKIPAIVQTAGGERSLELALIENIQREQLNPLEEARAFSTLMSSHDLTQEQIAARVGRHRSSIANALRLLKLPAPVQEMLRDGRLSAGHARALLSLEDEEEILQAAHAMLAAGSSVRSAEQMAREKKPAKARAAGDGESAVDPNVRDAEVRLQRALGTKVRIRSTGEGRGCIEIEFYSDEELQQLFETLEGSSTRSI
jgi:ParB family transcriptional regulator, chromosome partitioning protein